MARTIDKRIMLDLIIEARKTDPEVGPFSEWLAEYLVDHLPTLTPPNNPLTLDELREMDGEPVYVVFMPDSSGKRSQSWALVNVDKKYGEVYLVDSIPGASCYYDEIWANLEGIYRRPPERQEDTHDGD